MQWDEDRRNVRDLEMNLSLSFRKYLFGSESQGGLAAIPFLSRRIDGEEKQVDTSRETCHTWSSHLVSLVSVTPKRRRQTRQINTTREIARTGFSTGRDSALNGPFTNFDVSTYVSFQTFYEVVDRAAALDANFPPVKPFVSGNDDQLLRI